MRKLPRPLRAALPALAGLPVMLASEPMDCTVMGLGYLAENMQLLSSMSRQISEE